MDGLSYDCLLRVCGFIETQDHFRLELVSRSLHKQIHHHEGLIWREALNVRFHFLLSRRIRYVI